MELSARWERASRDERGWMTANDPVRMFLANRGCPEDVVAGGREGPISGWERAGARGGGGYPPRPGDYLTDPDWRQLAEEEPPGASGGRPAPPGSPRPRAAR